MKSEKRHEMETNWLAKHLAGWIESFKPYMSYAVGGVGVLLGLGLVSSLWGSHSADKDAAAWDAFGMEINSTDLEMQGLQRLAVADEHNGTAMQEWAYVTWAERQMLLAADGYFFDREGTQERLKPLEGIFIALADGSRDRVLQDRARFDLARVYELSNKLDQALEQYALVGGDFAKLAEEQIAKLEKPAVQTDCSWLAETKLPPRLPAVGPGTPGNRPNFEALVPAASGEEPAIDKHTLDDLLGSFGDESAGQDRYGEDDASEAAASETEASESPEAAEQAPADQDTTDQDTTDQ